MQKIRMKLQGVNIQLPWSTRILEGLKTVETRNYPCPDKFLNKPLFLIETPGKEGNFKARIVAVIEFTETFKYQSKSSYLADTKNHLVTEDSPFFWKNSKEPKYGWRVKLIKKVPKHEAPSKRGYVWTSIIDLKEMKKITPL